MGDRRDTMYLCLYVSVLRDASPIEIVIRLKLLDRSGLVGCLQVTSHLKQNGRNVKQHFAGKLGGGIRQNF